MARKTAVEDSRKTNYFREPEMEETENTNEDTEEETEEMEDTREKKKVTTKKNIREETTEDMKEMKENTETEDTRMKNLEYQNMMYQEIITLRDPGQRALAIITVMRRINETLNMIGATIEDLREILARNSNAGLDEGRTRY